MLGTLYWMTGKETEALSTFNEILKINEDISKSDPFFDIEMARLHEENDHATALKRKCCSFIYSGLNSSC